MAEQRVALNELYKALARAWENLLSLDDPSRNVLDLAYRSAQFDRSDPRRPRYPLATPGDLEGDQDALERLANRTAVALHLLPRAGGANPLHSLRWAIGELAIIYTGSTGHAFSVGRERMGIKTLNAPAYWVARVIRIIDRDVSEANLRTAFRQDFKTLQNSPRAQGV